MVAEDDEKVAMDQLYRCLEVTSLSFIRKPGEHVNLSKWRESEGTGGGQTGERGCIIAHAHAYCILDARTVGRGRQLCECSDSQIHGLCLFLDCCSAECIRNLSCNALL